MTTRNKVLSHAILVILLMSAFPLIIHASSQNVLAQSNNTWIATTTQSASNAAYWQNGTLTAGQNVWFINAYDGSCNWDVAGSFGNFKITTGYAGTITQQASFSVTAYSQVAGTYTGSVSYILTDSGNFVITGGTTVNNVLRLTMTGDGTIYSSSTVCPWLYDFTINNNVTWNLGISGVAHNLIVASEKTLTIAENQNLIWVTYYSGSIINSGIIAGTGTLRIRYYNVDTTLASIGMITAALNIYAHPDSTSNRICTLSTNITSPSTFLISSENAIFTMTLDLSASNHALSATDITIGTRGILNGRASTITCSGNWDSSAGTFTAGTSTLIMSGTSKTIKTANTNGAPYNLTISGTVSTLSSLNVTNNLTIDAGKSLTMGSGMSLTVGNLSSAGSLSLQSDTYTPNPVVNSGSIVQNGKRLNISGSSTTPYTGYGTFDGELALNGSTASNYEVQTGLPMGYLFTDRDTRISLDSTRYLQVIPQTSEFVNVSIKSYGSEGYVARWDATSTGPVTYSLIGAPGQFYDIWVDHATRVAVVQASINGLIQFTYNGPYSAHEFTVSVSGGIPSTLEASFEYIIDGSVITFTDKSYGGPTSWYWNFGDGYGSAAQNPIHKYARAGTYGVTLTVYDNKSHSSTVKVDIELKAGTNFPLQVTPGGWNVYLGNNAVVGVSAVGLVASGAFLLVSTYIYPGNIWRVTGNGRRILGIIMLGAGLYFFIFVAQIFG